MEINMEDPQKLKIETPYDPAIPLLGLYLKEFKSICKTDTCISMFLVALFPISKLWNHSRCPKTDEWIKEIRYT
jgi:hypothetical protein